MNPKEIRTAAASVRGARSAGIETPALRDAPALLARAEAALARLDAKAGVHSSPQELRGLDALESAVAELRDALGAAAPAPAPKAAEKPAAPAPAPAPQLRGEPCLTWARGEFRPALQVMGFPPRLGRETYQSRATSTQWNAATESFEQFDNSTGMVELVELMPVTDPRHPEWAALAERATADYWAANAAAQQLLVQAGLTVAGLGQAIRLATADGSISAEDVKVLNGLGFLASGVDPGDYSAMEAEYPPALERLCAALPAAEAAVETAAIRKAAELCPQYAGVLNAACYAGLACAVDDLADAALFWGNARKVAGVLSFHYHLPVMVGQVVV